MTRKENELLALLDELAAEERRAIPPAHLRQRILTDLAPAIGLSRRWWSGDGRPWLVAAVILLVSGLGLAVWRMRQPPTPLSGPPEVVAQAPGSIAPGAISEPVAPLSSPVIRGGGDDDIEDEPIFPADLDARDFEYLLYLEFPSPELQPGLDGDYPGSGMETGFTQVLVGDDGMVQAVQVRDRRSSPTTLY